VWSIEKLRPEHVGDERRLRSAGPRLLSTALTEQTDITMIEIVSLHVWPIKKV
jgi:hypothetical protein